ncbi:ribonuclease H-like domain-containing protein [Tanacetum coccineum]
MWSLLQETPNTPYPIPWIRRIQSLGYAKLNLDNLTDNVLILLDSWTSGLLVYKLPLSEVIEFESAQSNILLSYPLLNFENGNLRRICTQQHQENGTFVNNIKDVSTCNCEEKTNKKNDVKARSLLLMALPNEHQLTFSQYNDAKTMFAAIETRFGGSRRFLPPEWNTHVVVWMNKAEIETMSIDDLYNNFKIVEQSVKKYVGAVSGAQNLAFMTAPSTSSTNDVNTAKPAYEVSTVSPIVNTVIPQVSTASFSDNVVYAFMVENPNGSNLLQQDLEQIHEDDLEAMDLKWYDKFKVECFKCHKIGHFVRECRAPRNKEGQFMKHGNNEDTSSKAMLAIDGVGFDWSDMAKEQVQTNIALMAFLDSENEVLFSEEVAVLKREVACKDYEINVLKSEFEKVKQEKKGIEFKIEKFDKASKDLDKLLGSQITDKNPEFKSYGSEDSKQESNIVCDKKSDASKENSDDSLVKEQVSKDTSSFVESPLNVDKETIFLDKKIKIVKPKNHENPIKKSVRLIVNTIKGKGCGCSRDMTGNIAYLSDFKEFNRGYLTFGGGAHGGRISGKGTLKTNILDFEDVYFVNELNFNLFSVSQMYDKKNFVLFTNTECLELSPNFKLPDESQILLKIPRNDNMYSFDMKNIVPKESLTCLVAKATSDESMLWHRRLGKFDGKSDEGFFVGYSLSSKAFRVYNTRTRRVEENLHIRFLENKPMIEGNGPKWLFDIDSLTNITYVPVCPATNLKMNLQSDEKDKSEDDSSPKEVNAAGQHVNTASPEVNTDSPKDMFKLGSSHTLEATHVEFFSDEDEPEVDLGKHHYSFLFHTTPNIRIHKDHPIKNVIGDVKSSIQTRGITKSTSEHGFLSAVYEQKTHDTLNTCLHACFLSQIEPTSISKLYLIHLGWKQCKKNFCNSRSNGFRNVWICLMGRGPLEQNGSSETRNMKEGL